MRGLKSDLLRLQRLQHIVEATRGAVAVLQGSQNAGSTDIGTAQIGHLVEMVGEGDGELDLDDAETMSTMMATWQEAMEAADRGLAGLEEQAEGIKEQAEKWVEAQRASLGEWQVEREAQQLREQQHRWTTHWRTPQQQHSTRSHSNARSL